MLCLGIHGTYFHYEIIIILLLNIFMLYVCYIFYVYFRQECRQLP